MGTKWEQSGNKNRKVGQEWEQSGNKNPKAGVGVVRMYAWLILRSLVLRRHAIASQG